MEIERINENTVKLFISYVDIEARGFDREEIWYNRERSEELFWEMLEEIYHEDGFVSDGPLWIQIQADDKGLEVTVTKVPFTKEDLGLPFAGDSHDLFDKDLDQILEQNFQVKHVEQTESAGLDLELVIAFQDFEDILALAQTQNFDNLETKLFAFEGKYYLYARFSGQDFDMTERDNMISVLLEYGEESNYTVHRLSEYGKLVINDNVFTVLNEYFS